MRRGISRSVVLIIFWLFAARYPLFASGPYGADDGQAVASDGSPLVTKAILSQMAAAGTGWIRIEMRLLGHTAWDPTILGDYDNVVNNALSEGLQVILLVDSTSWPGGQSAWEANNAEVDGGNGFNDYVAGYTHQALGPIVEHFRGRVTYFEIWNEPNAWTQSYGVGGTFLYPSNFAWMLAESWKVAHIALHANVVLFSGGVYGHQSDGTSSYSDAGAQYVDDTYHAGIQYGPFTQMRRRYGTYPVDGVGQHIYIDQGEVLLAADFRLYEDYVREAYTKYESTATKKKTFITEVGWTTKSAVTQDEQDENLVTTFQTIDTTPYVQMAIWFQWADHPAANLYYGVIDSKGNPKLAFPDYEKYETVQGRFVDRTVDQPIANYVASTGPVLLGNPQNIGHGAFVYTVKDGEAQDYAGGSEGVLTVYAGEAGTFEVLAAHGIACQYQERGGPDRLGLPIGEEYLFANSFYRQDFQRGRVMVPVKASQFMGNACENEILGGQATRRVNRENVRPDIDR